jgi:hypothetical protein
MNKSKIKHISILSLVVALVLISWKLNNRTTIVESSDLKYILNQDTLVQIKRMNGTVHDVEKVYGDATYISHSAGSEVRHYLLVKKFPQLIKSGGIVGYSVEFRDNHIKSWETIEQAPSDLDR